MTHRERHIPDAASPRDVTWPPPAGPLGSVSASATEPSQDASLWQQWYEHASPAQQQEALLRALQQGILYAHQLSPPAQTAAPPRSLLTRLLNGQLKDLEPLHPPVLEYHDQELDSKQREAVARAVATPDMCLIQGYPGTGKSRLVAEIIRQAAQRGQRILFLAPTPAALDTVLERLGAHPAVCPIRCFADDEPSASLPPRIARLTLPERLRVYQETTLPAARAARAAASHALEDRLRQQDQWPRLQELAQQHERLAERLRLLNERRDGLAAEVERQEQVSATFRERWQAASRDRAQTLERLDSRLAELQAERETILGKQAHLDSEWERLRPLAEARNGHRFWTASWWSALLRGGLKEQLRELEVRRDELRAAQTRLEQELTARRNERAAIETQYADTCRRLQEEEIARRRVELEGELAAATAEQQSVRAQWQSICQNLSGDAAPAEISLQAVQTGLAAWEHLREQDVQRADSAEEWLQTVEEGVRTLPEKLASCANLVAATTATLASDAHFGDRNGTPAMLFDLLILEEAHEVTESEFAAAARRARRWVLVGEPPTDAELPAVPRKAVRPSVLRPGLFQRLWQNLHADPHRLPFAWMMREGRLVCRLRPLTAEQEKWIESEPVVDHADIELRILSMPRQKPQVVEILFPACMGISEARQFVFRELEELAVQTAGRSLCWSETADAVIVEMAPAADGESVLVPLESGVSERVHRLPVRNGMTAGGMDWHTVALEFARAAGWTRDRAETWVAERLGLRSSGRTVLLTVPHRPEPALARFLSDLLFAGHCQPATAAARGLLSRPAVEFVAVPGLGSIEGRHPVEAGGRNHGERSGGVSVRAPRLRAVKGGAGLEVDLADDRPLVQLPDEVRALLPRQGLVNYLEARALVKRLEALVHDEDFRLACERWRQRWLWPCQHGCQSPDVCRCPPPENGPAVAVIALYPSQVELLRHLIAQTSALAASSIPIEVGPPSAFCQRECLLALVSLTRSHAHRAVSYGDHPHALVQALTRAAAGLILFGDPGTLARRSQWQSSVDHLDEHTSQHESNLVGRLVQYLQGHGPHPEVFCVQEGSSV